MPVLYDPADGGVCANHLLVGAEPRPSHPIKNQLTNALKSSRS